MTQVFYCSTFFGALELCASIDAGYFGPHTSRRLLITSTNAAVPEIATRPQDAPGFDVLRERFDCVVHWNDIIAPLHPSGWSPPASEVPLLSRWLRTALGLHDEVSMLVVESVAVPPARTIMTLLPDCPVTVFADGLMSYGPTRNQLAGYLSSRVERLLYLDLVPGLRPLLLQETGADTQPISRTQFTEVLAAMPTPAGTGRAGDSPMIIGQYLSALDVVTPTQENELYANMLRGLAARGHERVVFKPHPAAGRAHVRPMQRTAQELGVELLVAQDVDSAEVWFAAARPQLVVSCFSTALCTASRLFGLPVATMGCTDVLTALRPYQNSNRIPVTIVDATVPGLAVDGSLQAPPDLDVDALVRAVGYCMQPLRGAPLRDDAAAFVDAHGPARYFKRRRLEVLGLLDPPAVRTVSQRAVRRARRLVRHVAVNRSRAGKVRS